MASRRAVFLLGLAAAVLVGTVLRLSTYRQLRAGPRTRAVSADDYYHLRRARFSVTHFPRTIFFDPLMNFPAGGVSIWPPLFDLALAAPSRILHGPYASREAIEREAAWVPLVLGLATVVVAGLLAARLYGALAGALVALFVAIAPGHLLWSQYGHVDQNVAESFAGVAALLAFVASREKPDSGGNVRREVVAGIVLTLAVLTWQGAIYWGAIFALALFIESLRTGRSVFRPAVATLALPAALAAGATLAWTRGLPAPFTYVSFGLFQPVFLAGLAAGLGLLDTAVARARGLGLRDPVSRRFTAAERVLRRAALRARLDRGGAARVGVHPPAGEAARPPAPPSGRRSRGGRPGGPDGGGHRRAAPGRAGPGLRPLRDPRLDAPDASPPGRPVRRAAVRPASSSARARASHRGPRSVVARTPRAVRIGGPGGRQQFRVRLPRLDPVLPRVVGSRGPRDRAEPARPVGPRGGPGAAPERLRGVPGPPAAPRSDRPRARPSPRPF